jgi:hypothetical protein
MDQKCTVPRDGAISFLSSRYLAKQAAETGTQQIQYQIEPLPKADAFGTGSPSVIIEISLICILAAHAIPM